MKAHVADGALVLLPTGESERRRQLEFLHHQLWESFKCASLCVPAPPPPLPPTHPL